MNYVGPDPDGYYYVVDQMHESEMKYILSWYETVAMNEVFVNRRELECYCQADVTVLPVACRNFLRHCRSITWRYFSKSLLFPRPVIRRFEELSSS